MRINKSITCVLPGILVAACVLSNFHLDLMAQDSRTRSLYVTVTKEGQFVDNLTLQDFKLFEDGKQIKIDTLEKIPAEKRLIVIFHDPQFWPREVMNDKEALADELLKLVEYGYEVMVFQLTWTDGLARLRPYSSQEGLVRESFIQAMTSIGTDKSLDDIGARLLEIDASTETIASMRLEQQGEMQAYLNINRRRFEKAVGGILAACNLVRTEGGSGSLLLISSGIPDLSSSNRARILEDTTADARSTLDAIHSRDQQYIGNLRLFDPFNVWEDKKFNRAEEVLEEVVRFASSQDVAIYSLDPGVFSRSVRPTSTEIFRPEDILGVRISEEEIVKQKQNLRLLSEQTNAAFFRGSDKYQDMQQAMGGGVEHQYRLSFKPGRNKPDGKSHKLEVKVTAVGADTRFNQKYTDYAADDVGKVALVSAFYNPGFYTDLPFDADFIPFISAPGEYLPWVNLAMPTKELFNERGAASEGEKKNFRLNFWIQEAGELDKGFRGMINISLTMTQSLMDYIDRSAYLWLYFRGEPLPLDSKRYQAVYALVDTETREIGTWKGLFSIPQFKEEMQGAFINCVLGSATENQERKDESFDISSRNGYLEYGGIRFFPKVNNIFGTLEDGYVFLQIYAPQGETMIQPEFIIYPAEGDDSFGTNVPGERIAGSFNPSAKVWSGIYKLNLFSVFVGEHVFQVRIPAAEGEAISSRKIRLIKLRK